MTFGGKYATALLFVGDIAVFFLSLWLTLLVRYLAVPSQVLFADHILAFLPLFCLWLVLFAMAGLYGKRVILFKKAQPGLIFGTQFVNIVLAALYFFLVPGIGLTPKTNLALYLIVSLVLISLWRLMVFPRVTRPTFRERAALIAVGTEADELAREVNEHPRYHIEFLATATPTELAHRFDAFAKRLAEAQVTTLVVDTENDELRPLLPRLYELAFVTHRYQVLDFYRVYEEVFDRMPLSLLQYDWFLRHVSDTAPDVYRSVKRLIDIGGGLAMGCITVVATPFVALALAVEGPGPVFIRQERIGQYGTRITAYKFRSMRFNKTGSREWTVEEANDNPVTRVGSFLRLTSLDEFPQFVNILSGELSLIGPRNDIEGLGTRLAAEIPYYNVRYIVKPGITGWAQINQRYEPGNISPQSIEETKTRLAYDFYYIKNRSLALDIIIALKTVKRMFFRVGAL